MEPERNDVGYSPPYYTLENYFRLTRDCNIKTPYGCRNPDRNVCAIFFHGDDRVLKELLDFTISVTENPLPDDE